MTQHEGQSDLELKAPRSGALDAVRSILARLPAEQREIVVLRGYYRMTRDEIGALLGQPVARIDGLYRAAVRNLRSLLGRPQRTSFA